MGRRSVGSPVVRNALCLANSRRVLRDKNGEVIKDKDGNVETGLTYVEFLCELRNEAEALLERGEMELAASAVNGLSKLNPEYGFTARKALERMVKAQEEAERQEELKRQHEATKLEVAKQKEDSERRAKLAREEREAELREALEKKELARRLKEDKDLYQKYVASGKKLPEGSGLTHNPFAALKYAPVVVAVPEVCVGETFDGVEEVASLEEVDEVLEAYTVAIEACQQNDQWEDVQEVLGEDFFNRNVDAQLVAELVEAMEVVADCQ